MRFIPTTLLVLVISLISILPAQVLAQGSGLDTLDRRSPAQKFDTSDVRVVPWQFSKVTGSEIVSTDSISRWQLWLHWAEHKERDNDVLTYRLGRQGRTDAIIFQTHEPKHQELYWEEVSLNDPVSQSINWNMIPQFKIEKMTEQPLGIDHTTRFSLRQYYLNKPLTKLNYTEGKSSFRSLNFMLSQNLGRKTNYELSYWDRRDGSDLPRDELGGLQMFARVFHTFNDKHSLKASFLMTDYDVDESFGFQIPDLRFFDFNFENVAPNNFNTRSNTAAKNTQISYYNRPDTNSAHNFQATVFWNTRERDIAAQPDTIDYNITSFGGSVRKWLDVGSLSLNGAARVETFSTDKSIAGTTLGIDGWTLAEGEITAEFSPFKKLKLEGKSDISLRSDNEQSFSISSKVTYQLVEKVSVSANGSIGQAMPTIQEKYWQSATFQGNSNLEAEDITRIGGQIEYQPNEELKAGVKGELKEIENGVHLSEDNQFTNMQTYEARSVTAYGDWNTSSYELKGSVTWHSYSADQLDNFTSRLLRGQDRLFLKGGAYWKGYAFNRATFMKVGLWSIFSPNQYLAAQYRPILDRWQNANTTQLIPSFYRVDLDISARVRWIMFTLRMENLLDDVGQAGYFNTAQYPLPNRRFLFGLKVRFRN